MPVPNRYPSLLVPGAFSRMIEAEYPANLW
jgi:hypothetical protein